MIRDDFAKNKEIGTIFFLNHVWEGINSRWVRQLKCLFLCIWFEGTQFHSVPKNKPDIRLAALVFLMLRDHMTQLKVMWPSSRVMWPNSRVTCPYNRDTWPWSWVTMTELSIRCKIGSVFGIQHSYEFSNLDIDGLVQEKCNSIANALE